VKSPFYIFSCTRAEFIFILLISDYSFFQPLTLAFERTMRTVNGTNVGAEVSVVDHER
jgi:hypothetical protein